MTGTERDIEARTSALSQLAASKDKAVTDHQLETYLALVADIPTPLLIQTCLRLAKAATYGFPHAADLLLMADKIQAEGFAAKSDALALPSAPHTEDLDRRAWVHCRSCDDEPSAWRSGWCHGSGRFRDESKYDAFTAKVTHFAGHCGVERPHTPHSFAERCGCHDAPWRQAKRAPKAYGKDMRRGS